MSKEIIAEAWDAVKLKDDPTFFNTAPDHQRVLTDAAADVIKTGVTANAFERKVKELYEAQVETAPQTPLGTTAEEPKTRTKPEPASEAKDNKSDVKK